jgi:hypothetical protein
VSSRLASFSAVVNSLSSFVDRDMLMRFHWGQAVGHVYTHQQRCTNTSVNWDVDISESENIPEQGGVGPSSQSTPEDNLVDSRTDGSDSDLEDEDFVLSDTDDDLNSEDSSDDEHWLDVDEMYGQDDSDEDLY